MRSLFFLVPGRLETRTGGYEYDRRVIAGLRDRGWSIDVREIEDSFPDPTPAALDEADRVLAAVPDGMLVVVDGLAFSALPSAIERHSSRLSLVPIVHALIGGEIGIDAETAAKRQAGERRAFAGAARVVIAGRALIEPLTHLGVRPDRVIAAEPGTDPAPLARGSRDAIPHLVMVATLNPGKGHDVLVRALATLTNRHWRLTCAGSPTRHVPTAMRLRSLLGEMQLTDRVSLAGELDAPAIADLYDSADVFVLPTLSETHPLTVAEALARGLPVVSTTAGAIPDLVLAGPEPAGLLVPPGDVGALANALARVLDDSCCRERLAEGARRVRERLPSWDTTVTKVAAALDGIGRQ